MESSQVSRTLGVVVVYKPDGEITALPAVRDLVGQLDELLVIRNGNEGAGMAEFADVVDPRIRLICFETNRGTAAAWNAALASAIDRNYRYLYILDQDSIPSSDAVPIALTQMEAEPAAALVQPAQRDRFRLDPFPWNTVASGSLLDVGALQSVGGFDERLFVDEVDHEVFARLVLAGFEVRPLTAATIRHQTGSPRPIRVLGRAAVVSGHSEERRRLQGYSAGLLVRRNLRRAPSVSARLLVRHTLTAGKDVLAGERSAAHALLSGLASGSATSRPPVRAAERSCPFCDGPLLGRFGAVPDWLFANGAPGDVYRCATCGALAAGRVPAVDEVASWYSSYYTHAVDPTRTRIWSRFWPTPRRRRELKRLSLFLSTPGTVGRFLEVGTGSGERLVEFADAGWDVVGQDLDPKAGHLAGDRGLKVYQCRVADLVGTEAPFDLIGLSHVLEHALDPVELLTACGALLAPAGRLCIICPNAHGLGRWLFGRWWLGLDQPRHLAIPTMGSLERLAARVGLQVTQAESVSTNAAVFLGGSLARGFQKHLPPGPLRRGARFCMAFVGQAMGRGATLVNHRLGEELVWVGQRGQA